MDASLEKSEARGSSENKQDLSRGRRRCNGRKGEGSQQGILAHKELSRVPVQRKVGGRLIVFIIPITNTSASKHIHLSVVFLAVQ